MIVKKENKNLFKKYDIRGIYPQDLDKDFIKSFAKAFVSFAKTKEIVIGYDKRDNSKEVFKILSESLIDSGVNVIDIGLASSPMLYFASGFYHSVAIMITASHNPLNYSGFKLCHKGALPMNFDDDFKKIIALFSQKKVKSKKKGKLIKDQLTKKEYQKMLQKQVKFSDKPNISVDFLKAVGEEEFSLIQDYFSFSIVNNPIDLSNKELSIDPAKKEIIQYLEKEVKEKKKDFGIAFDPDADRVVFVSPKRGRISNELISLLLAKEALSLSKGKEIVYDLRFSPIIFNKVKEINGKITLSQVGHSYMKKTMALKNAIYGGEFSGHHYFKDNYFAESSSLAVIYLVNLFKREGKTLDQLLDDIPSFYTNDEESFKVSDKELSLKKIKDFYKEEDSNFLDGILIHNKNWWFSVRLSNTENLIRVVLGAKDKESFQQKRKEILTLIKN